LCSIGGAMSHFVCVEESDKTKRAREKLKKRLEKLEKKITQDALKSKVTEIHDRISRHAANRVVLTKKTISLFDNNQNSAEISMKVSLISQKIKENSSIFLGADEKKDSLKDHEYSLSD
jgi:hypothetical protein